MTRKERVEFNKKTKKQIIIDLVNSLEWSEGTKYISQQDLRKFKLKATIEYGEKWTDIHYLKKVLTKIGYRVLIGSWCIYIEKSQVERTKPQIAIGESIDSKDGT